MNDFFLMLTKLVVAFCNIAFWLVIVTVIYNLFLMICGIPKNKKLDLISQTAVKPKTRFAIIISARNEEVVIPYLIRSLKAMDYPEELYNIFVIADNCSDHTAMVAKNEGAKVYSRNDQTRATKGYALNWFFSHNLNQMLKQYDHCVIFDADNLVDPNFLKMMDRHIQTGKTFLAGYMDCKSPEKSVIASANALFYLNRSRYLHQARNNLDLPLASVSGTGFSFDLQLIKDTGWKTQTLTEDVEFTIQMILKDQNPVYVKEAIFYDEPTSEFKPMIRQRFRWGMGSVQTMRLMTGKLFRYALHFNHKAFDAFWFLAQIPFFFIAGMLSIVKMLIQLPMYLDNPAWFARDLIIPALAYIVTVLSLILLVKLEKKSLKLYQKGILAYPILGIVWAGLQMAAMFCKDAIWHPIVHSHGVELKNLIK
ncbi:MAG: glycosyltransferase family 2 protein [Saccharofermentanales bacterium]|jgi:cellulose synthase/poly-beta-1,6-N-acetylglucosamine synthase-like glycosyltransferase